MSTTTTPESDPLARLRASVQRAFDQDDIPLHIRSLLHVSQEDNIKRSLLQSGVIDDLTQCAREPAAKSSKRPVNKFELLQKLLELKESAALSAIPPSPSVVSLTTATAASPSSSSLGIHIHGGKAFLSELTPSPDATLRVHVSCQHHRVQSQSFPASVDPLIDQRLSIPLSCGTVFLPLPSQFTSAKQALESRSSLHFVVVKEHPLRLPELIGLGELDWRPALHAPQEYRKLVVINSLGTTDTASAGLLDVSIHLPVDADRTLGDMLKQITEDEQREESDALRKTFASAKLWWNQYAMLRPGLGDRPVKLFALDEQGTHRSVMSFISPWPSTYIQSARQAARFVSLLAVERSHGPPVTAEAVWRSPATVLATKSGSTADHSVMLCSLLLGLGLPAFVTIGTDGRGECYTWVSVIASAQQVAFFDSVTGDRYKYEKPSWNATTRRHPFCTITCLISDTALYANCQESEAIDRLSFALGDARCWKRMAADDNTAKMRSPSVPLQLYKDDTYIVEARLQEELCALVTSHRELNNLPTSITHSLDPILRMSLVAHEDHQLYSGNLADAQDDFQCAIQSRIPPGFLFQGCPMHFPHAVPPQKILAGMLRDPGCSGLVMAAGIQVQHAVVVHCRRYAELVSIWVMVGVVSER
ncbi:Centrosomal protein of 76 kDa [Sorochytrium milnesiophthora]